MKGVLFSILVLLLSGCATYPEVVKVPEGTNLVAFATVSESNSNSNNLGQQARWSGVIASVTNLTNQTRLEVLYYPSESNGRPKVNGEPQGRYRVYVDKFLEPEVYKKGKAITVLGNIKSSEMAKIGEYEYEYPTLEKSTLYLWPKRKNLTQVEFYYGWHGFYPRYYWRGGARHVYIVGQSGKKTPTKVSPKRPPKQ
jgi:outer membrane lipoprotein